MARFGWASGGYAKGQIQGGTRQSVRRRGGACVSAFALMTSLALGVPVLAKKAMAEGGKQAVVCGSNSECVNDDTVSVTGGDGQASGQKMMVGSGAGGTFTLTNTIVGSLDVKSGTSKNSYASAQYLEIDSGRSGSTAVMENHGMIAAESRLQQATVASGNTGMEASVDGSGNKLTMRNTGDISSKGYYNETVQPGITKFGSDNDVLGMSVGIKSGNRADLINDVGGTIRAQTWGNGSDAFGMWANLSGTDVGSTLTNNGKIAVSIGGRTYTNPQEILGAVGMEVFANGATGSAQLINTGDIEASAVTAIYRYDGAGNGQFAGEAMSAHGMVVGISGSTIDMGAGDKLETTVANSGTLKVSVGGNGGFASGIAVGSLAGGGISGHIVNKGNIAVEAPGLNGTAYGIHAFLGRNSNKHVFGVFGKDIGDNTFLIESTGIVSVRGAIAHQLYVSNDLDGQTRGGLANVSVWNLSPVKAGSEDQRAFAVAGGATLNLGDDKGKGAQLILRTSDAGNNGHDGVAVRDLIANKGGTVTGVIDTVYSGGNVDGQNAADYQATLEGYNDYTQQSVYIDRAWQFNAAGDTMNAVQCATISCGLYSSTQGLGLVNAGTLDADVGNGVGAGMYANLRTMAGITNRPVSLSNSGTITMKAGDSGAAYGMYARLQDADQVANISNTGVISVRGATAHQLYVSGMPGVGGGTANVTTWNLDLYDRQSGRQSVFAVADGATLNFSNTHMMLRPGDVAKGYADNKKFNVKDMVYNYGNGAQVTGQIGSVSTPLPMLTAAYGRVDQNGADVWDNQWVSLNVEAEKGDGPTVNAGTVDSMQSQIDRVGNLLVGGASGGGIGLGDGDLTSVQLKVYYGNQQRRGVGASVTDSTGTVAYADYEIGEGHTLGWHGGVEYAHLRAKSKTLNINSLSAILGGQGRYNFSDTTYLRGQVSGILSNNNNHFNAFDGSTSKVSTVNFGMYGAVYAGYDYKPDENNTVTPEIGLSALWSHTPSMDVKYDRSPDLNHTYAAQNYTALYANAGVRWTGGVDINGTLLKPTVMAGVRQTLGDGKVKSAMTFNGNRFDTSITRDRTMGIVDAGVSTTVSTGFDVGLNYRGEYGSNTTNHVGYLNGTIRF